MRRWEFNKVGKDWDVHADEKAVLLWKPWDSRGSRSDGGTLAGEIQDS